MAEKWGEGTGTNDSPEVVYEGYSPPTQPHCPAPATSFTPTDNEARRTDDTNAYVQPGPEENEVGCSMVRITIYELFSVYKMFQVSCL